MSKMTDAIFSAIQGAALASLDGRPDTETDQLKREIEKLDLSDVEGIQGSKIDAKQWADVFLSGLALGKMARDIVRTMRGLP